MDHQRYIWLIKLITTAQHFLEQMETYPYLGLGRNEKNRRMAGCGGSRL